MSRLDGTEHAASSGLASPSTEFDKRYYVASAARTMRLLAAIAEIEAPATLSKIVAEVGWSKPMVYRLVRTLESVEALRYDDGKGYVLGPTLITLGQRALQANGVVGVARPYLAKLRDELGETIALSMLEGDESLHLAHFESDKLLMPRVPLSSRFPAYCTAAGHALLAGLDDDEITRRHRHRRFEKITPNTLTSLEELLKRVGRVRTEGYAVNDQELDVGICSIAAPVRDQHDTVVAAVSVSIPASRATRRELKRMATQALIPTTERVSLGLGATPRSPFAPREVNRRAGQEAREPLP